MSKAAKIVTAICIACVAVMAILWIGITSVDRDHVVPAPATPDSED